MPRPDPGPTDAVRADLLAAARFVTRDGDHLRFDGHPICPVPRSSAAYARVVALVEPLLYVEWYAGAPRVMPRAASAPRTLGPGVSRELIARLRRAHAASDRREAGWVVMAPRSNGGVLATRGQEPAVLDAGDYTNLTRASGPARAGDSIQATARRDRIADGWWVTWPGGRADPAGTLLRLYWNCPAACAPALVGDLTALFDSRRQAYSLKCPTDESLFDRRDAVVCYLPARAWVDMKDDVRALYARHAAGLRDAVPALTLRLGRGLGLAEDPGGAQSFGQSRARAVADGTLAAAIRDAVSDTQAIDIIATRLEAHGIRASCPHVRHEARTYEW